MFTRVIQSGGVVLALALGAGLIAKEPANLEIAKAEVRTYVKSGEFDRDFTAVAAEAQQWVEQRAKQGSGKLAMVFDLDETLLSNMAIMRKLDFGFEFEQFAALWNAAQCPVNGPVRNVYLAARRAGVAVIYITGRSERFRDGTVRNLQTVGCGDYAKLICRPADWKGTTGEYKTTTRARLEAEGYTIIGNIGDQLSDLEGGHAERTFKLPNPFYLTK